MDQGIKDAFIAVSTVVRASAPARTKFVYSALARRWFDILLAGLGCLVLLPILIFVSVILLVVQGRPIFIAHRRIGKDGRSFSCIKFRSMVVDGNDVLARHFERCPGARAEWERFRKLKNDPRVTAMGRTLRASSVDELPQLINVLRGDMSLVGPRPIVEEELSLYGIHAQKYLAVRPGLTGAWQVSGRSNTKFEERVKLDVDYVDTQNFSKDIAILLRTIPTVLFSKGAI